jgi:hypothetical protein
MRLGDGALIEPEDGYGDTVQGSGDGRFALHREWGRGGVSAEGLLDLLGGAADADGAFSGTFTIDGQIVVGGELVDDGHIRGVGTGGLLRPAENDGDVWHSCQLTGFGSSGDLPGALV